MPKNDERPQLPGYKQKDSLVVVYTGDGKGKTSASIGLLVRSLGAGMKVAFVQFIKEWEVSEHKFFQTIQPLYKSQFSFFKGGLGFHNLGEMSAKGVDAESHRNAAQATYSQALDTAQSGDYDLVICDEINVAVQEGLLTPKQLQILIQSRSPKTSLCLSGRGFPEKLIDLVDIATSMTKLKHHFDDKFIANAGIDY